MEEKGRRQESKKIQNPKSNQWLVIRCQGSVPGSERMLSSAQGSLTIVSELECNKSLDDGDGGGGDMRRGEIRRKFDASRRLCLVTCLRNLW